MAFAIGYFILAVSVIFQIDAAMTARARAAQSKKEAEARADEAKGFKLVVDGESKDLPVCYGRNMIGGVRVYHNTFNNYYNANVVNTISKTITNLALQSEDISSTSWTKINTTIGDTITLLNAVSAKKLLATSTASVHDIIQTLNVSAGNVSMSAFVVPVEYTRVYLAFDGTGAFSSEQSCVIDLLTDTVETKVGTVVYTSEHIGDDCVRIGISALASTSGVATCRIRMYDASGSSFSGTGTEGIYIGGIQVEATEIPSEYVKTTTTAASRNISSGTTFKASTKMDLNITGIKHEFLGVQQALCIAGINKIYAINIDDRPIEEVVYDYGLKMNVYEDGAIINKSVSPWGTKADPLILANDSSRSTAKFNNVAYASCVFRLNRDDPQFSGVPTVQFFLEGMKVYDIIHCDSVDTPFMLSTYKTYSNNPARCLLDYLLNTVYGRGLSLDEVDLESFYTAKRICDRTIISDVPIEGSLWKGKLGQLEILPLAYVNKGKFISGTPYSLGDVVYVSVGYDLGGSGTSYVTFSYQKTSGPNSLTYPSGIATGGGVFSAPTIISADWEHYSSVLRDRGDWVSTHGYSATDKVLYANIVYQLYYTATTSYDSNNLYHNTTTPNYDPNWKVWNSAGVWVQTDNSKKVHKLYEANLSLSSAKTLRDNIEILLETMVSAELVWSGGKYKLSLLYPEVFQYVNGALDTSKTYDIGDVVQYEIGGSVDLYKSKSSLNAALPTDTAYWETSVVSKYITDSHIIPSGDNAVTWPTANNRLNRATVRFSNESKDFAEDSVSWPPKSGIVEGACKDRGNYSSTLLYDKSDKVTDPSSTPPGKVYQLKNGDKVLIPIAPHLDTDEQYWVEYDNNNVYNIYRAEDSGMPLEADFFETGITDYYHAMAKAEQRVRSSRTNITYKFSVSIDCSIVEPGDIIKVTSSILNIPGELLKVEDVKVGNGGVTSVSATKYDARMLAWNAKDNEVVDTRNLFDWDLKQITDLVFTYSNSTSTFGTLSWTLPEDPKVDHFLIKYTTDAFSAIDENTVWIEVGSTFGNSFEMPYVGIANIIITVVSSTANGKLAPKQFWPVHVLDPSLVNFPPVTGAEIIPNDGSDVNMNTGLILQWNPVVSDKFDHYEIRLDNATSTSWDTSDFFANTTSHSVEIAAKVLTGTSATIVARIKVIDKVGRVSTESIGASTASFVVTPPLEPDVTSMLIGNVVQINWTKPISSQPIRTYILYRGDAYPTIGTQSLGEKNGLFTTISEAAAGTYTYWVAAVDVAGNIGVAKQTSEAVLANRDYATLYSELSVLQTSTHSNVTLSSGTYYDTSLMFVDTTYFLEDYITRIPYLPDLGVFEEVFDFGYGLSVLISASVNIALSPDIFTVYTSYSADNITYSTPTLGTYGVMINARYLKITITNNTGTGSYLNILKTVLTTQKVTQIGMIDCLATDGTVTGYDSGTLVTIVGFSDVSYISVTANVSSGDPIYASFNYDDITIPSPTSFRVLLYNSNTGARVDGKASYYVEGV